MSEAAVVVDESQEFGSCLVDGLKSLFQLGLLCWLQFCCVLLFVIEFSQQSLAERSNRRDGIHYFMCQHTNQLNP